LRSGILGLHAAYRRLAPWAYGAVIVALYVWEFSGVGLGDLHAYFRAAADPAAMYAQHAVDTTDAYMYAPVFAQVLAPLARLGWLMFSASWFALLAASLWWLAREWSLAALIALALSFRWPGTWALPLLAKPTIGVGLLWFAVRREWRSLGIALGTTALLGLCSAILAPSLWLDWLRVLEDNAASAAPNSYDAPFQFFPLAPRLAVAAILVVWGALRDRHWTLIVAALIAMPVVWRTAPVMLVGLLPLLRASTWSTEAPGVTAASASSSTGRSTQAVRARQMGSAREP
jgi:hypothetical protein